MSHKVIPVSEPLALKFKEKIFGFLSLRPKSLLVGLGHELTEETSLCFYVITGTTLRNAPPYACHPVITFTTHREELWWLHGPVLIAVVQLKITAPSRGEV